MNNRWRGVLSIWTKNKTFELGLVILIDCVINLINEKKNLRSTKGGQTPFSFPGTRRGGGSSTVPSHTTPSRPNREGRERGRRRRRWQLVITPRAASLAAPLPTTTTERERYVTYWEEAKEIGDSKVPGQWSRRSTVRVLVGLSPVSATSHTNWGSGG